MHLSHSRRLDRIWIFATDVDCASMWRLLISRRLLLGMLCNANSAEKCAPRHQADQQSYSTCPWHLQPCCQSPKAVGTCHLLKTQIRLTMQEMSWQRRWGAGKASAGSCGHF
eukprot:s19_g5.t1